MATTTNECELLCIMLATAGNAGEKLYFKYPYEPFLQKKKASKQAISISDDQQNLRSRSVSFTSNTLVTPDRFADSALWSFSDSLLASILSPKEAMCNNNFTLAIDDILFIGYPTVMKDLEYSVASSSASGSPASSFKSSIATNLLHIVFVLQDGAPSVIVNAFHKLSQRIAAAIKHEQIRRNYLFREVEVLSSIHDKYNDSTEGETNCSLLYEKIVDDCLLAHQLKLIYERVARNELVQIKINNWIDVTFNVPTLPYGDSEYHPSVEEPQTVHQKIQPYHSLLMLVNSDELIQQLPTDCSQAMIRLIQVISPFRCLQALALDADLTLNQVKLLASHLVFWGKASLIYPICETNVYILTPEAPTDISSPLIEEFSNTFAGLFMPVFMGEFSAGLRPLNEHNEKFNLSKDMLGRIVTWMLRNRVIMQQHQYILLVCKREIRDIKFETDDDQLSENCKYQISKQLPDLVYLSESHKTAVVKYVSTKQSEDIQFFMRLCRYFNGRHHIEDIMYWENMPRAQIFELLNRFNQVTVTFWLKDIASM